MSLERQLLLLEECLPTLPLELAESLLQSSLRVPLDQLLRLHQRVVQLGQPFFASSVAASCINDKSAVGSASEINASSSWPTSCLPEL